LALIAAGSTWFSRQHHQQTLSRALIAAIKRSDAAAVDSLLAAGADPNARDTPIETGPLLQKLKHLLHPPPHDLSKTALILAVYVSRTYNTLPGQSPATVNALLARGADVNAYDEAGNTPITVLFIGFRSSTAEFHACWNPRLLTALLNAHPDIETTRLTDTPLMLACDVRDVVSVGILLEHGANANARSAKFGTPLSSAIEWGDTDIINLLRAHGAKE
jgi:ankyrin repeat protein